MKKINYPLILSDFDGTLADDNHTVGKNVRDAINEYVACGGIFAVITGRMMSSVLPQVRSLGLKGLVAGYQGTVIADIESGRFIRRGGFGYGDAVEICKEINKIGGKCNLYWDEVLYSERGENDELLKLYVGVTKAETKCLDCTAVEFLNKNKPVCQKITVLVMPEERDDYYDKLKSALGDKYDVTYSAVVLVEISPKGDNKGAALKFIAENYGIPIERTVAVGDSLNDLPMIQTAGVGVATGNAERVLKEAADYITVTNNEGAIAAVIGEFGFEKS